MLRVKIQDQTAIIRLSDRVICCLQKHLLLHMETRELKSTGKSLFISDNLHYGSVYLNLSNVER